MSEQDLTSLRKTAEAATPGPWTEFHENGTPGELVIAGDQLAEGYLEAPELTAARFRSLNGKRWYRTGDLALRDAAGRFHCLGRIDNQVKVLGYRVELEEIDARVGGAIDVADLDAAFGEREGGRQRDGEEGGQGPHGVEW